jgi:hypothetical protein
MMPITLPIAPSVERNRPISRDVIRKRALQRLYRRHTAVEDLIRSLEIYRRSAQGRNRLSGAERREVSATPKSPLNSAR